MILYAFVAVVALLAALGLLRLADYAIALHGRLVDPDPLPCPEFDEWRRIHQRAAADVHHQIDDDLAWWHTIGEAWPEEDDAPAWWHSIGEKWPDEAWPEWDDDDLRDLLDGGDR